MARDFGVRAGETRRDVVRQDAGDVRRLPRRDQVSRGSGSGKGRP